MKKQSVKFRKPMAPQRRVIKSDKDKARDNERREQREHLKELIAAPLQQIREAIESAVYGFIDLDEVLGDDPQRYDIED